MATTRAATAVRGATTRAATAVQAPPPEYQPPGPAGYPPPGSGSYPGGAAPGYPGGAPGYPAGGPAYGYPPPARGTNSLAIAAIICSLGGLITGISAPIGAVLGHMASRQIAQTGEEGEGLAKAAIIIGWVLTGLIVLACCAVLIVLWAAAASV